MFILSNGLVNLDDEDQVKIDVLKGLGFSPKEAAVALSMTQGDLEKAAQLVDNLKHEKEFERTGNLSFEEEEEEVFTPLRRGRKIATRILIMRIV